jgi:hypothetical protein
MSRRAGWRPWALVLLLLVVVVAGNTAATTQGPQGRRSHESLVLTPFADGKVLAEFTFQREFPAADLEGGWVAGLDAPGGAGWLRQLRWPSLHVPSRRSRIHTALPPTHPQPHRKPLPLPAPRLWRGGAAVWGGGAPPHLHPGPVEVWAVGPLQPQHGLGRAPVGLAGGFGGEVGARPPWIPGLREETSSPRWLRSHTTHTPHTNTHTHTQCGP